ncbi:MAG: hypothetical protein ACI3WR_06805 [Oscillospiraceae bacterium]
MSEILFMIIAGICCSCLAILPAFVELPFVLMLVLAIVPILACIPFMVSKKSPAKKD